MQQLSKFQLPPAPQYLVGAAQPLADALNLPVLPEHIHIVLLFLGFYSILFSHVSPILSTYFFPHAYPGSREYKSTSKSDTSNGRDQEIIKKKQRISTLHWDVAVVSLVQSTIVSIFALYLVLFDTVRGQRTWQGRIWACNDEISLGGLEGMIGAVALGYFLWHFIAMIVYRESFIFDLP